MTNHKLNIELKVPKTNRIAKVIARAGLCSRREAEKLIIAGRVKLDGQVLTNPAVKVKQTDAIQIDDEQLPKPTSTRLWRYYKPAGLLTSQTDKKGRPTIFDELPKSVPRLISVGRLDMNSEGLLLMTNNGDLARKLELPLTGWKRSYRVRVHGKVIEDKLATLDGGIIVKGIEYGPISATLDRQQGSNAWLTISLSEGKNREIRNVMEYFGWHVTRLIRTSFGPFELNSLAKGQLKVVKQKILETHITLE